MFDPIKELAKQKNPYIRREMSKADALTYFRAKGDEYKLDLLEGLEDGTITFYDQGNFTDLCRGPHMPHTGFVKACKVMSIAGAYWKGDESQKQLTRVYGITPTKLESKSIRNFLSAAPISFSSLTDTNLPNE